MLQHYSQNLKWLKHISLLILTLPVFALPICESELEAKSKKRLELNLDVRSATWGAKEIIFSSSEFHVLNLLVKSSPKIVSKDELAKLVWGAQGAGDSDVQMVIVHIRKKFRESDLHFNMLKTKFGVGYFWDDEQGQKRQIGPLHFYVDTGFIRYGEDSVELSAWESNVLEIMSRQPNTYFSYKIFGDNRRSNTNSLPSFQVRISNLNSRVSKIFKVPFKIIKRVRSENYGLNHDLLLIL